MTIDPFFSNLLREISFLAFSSINARDALNASIGCIEFPPKLSCSASQDTKQRMRLPSISAGKDTQSVLLSHASDCGKEMFIVRSSFI